MDGTPCEATRMDWQSSEGYRLGGTIRFQALCLPTTLLCRGSLGPAPPHEDCDGGTKE